MALTLPRVMTPWEWIGIVMARSDTRRRSVRQERAHELRAGFGSWGVLNGRRHWVPPLSAAPPAAPAPRRSRRAALTMIMVATPCAPGKIPDEPAGSRPRIPRPISCATGFHRGSPQCRARQTNGSWRCPASVVQSQLRRYDGGNKQPEPGLSPELITWRQLPGHSRPMCAGVSSTVEFSCARPDACRGGLHHRGPLRADGGRG